MWTRLHNGMSGAGRDPLKQETDLQYRREDYVTEWNGLRVGLVGSRLGRVFSPEESSTNSSSWPLVARCLQCSTEPCAKQWLQFAPPAQCVKCHLCIVVSIPTQSTHGMQPGLTYSVICSNCESSFEESWVDMCWAGGTHVSAGQGKARPSR